MYTKRASRWRAIQEPDHSHGSKMAGSATVGGRQALRRATRRGGQWLRRRNRSMKVGSGTNRQGKAKTPPGRRARRGAKPALGYWLNYAKALPRWRMAGRCGAPQDAQNFRCQDRERRLEGRRARLNHNIPSWNNLLAMLTQNFANSPAHAVAHCGPAQRLAYAHSEAVAVETVAAVKNDQQRAGPAMAFAVHRVKLAAVDQAEGSEPSRGPGRRGVRRG